jgi:DNA-binding CsgD family transcriptional regulator
MYTTEAATLADALDGLGAGLFVVDAAGRIVHANASGRAMLRERLVLRDAEGRLVACEARAASALNEVIAESAGPDARPTAWPLSAGDGRHYVAHLLPLASGARRVGATLPALTAVFVHKAVIEAHCPPDVIARLYHLTPGELRVLLAIVEVGGVAETARALGVAEATVKTHLHRLFGKTGASRQADLVKLVAGFSNPLVGGSRPPPPPGQGGRLMDVVSITGPKSPAGFRPGAQLAAANTPAPRTALP